MWRPTAGGGRPAGLGGGPRGPTCGGVIQRQLKLIDIITRFISVGGVFWQNYTDCHGTVDLQSYFDPLKRLHNSGSKQEDGGKLGDQNEHMVTLSNTFVSRHVFCKLFCYVSRVPLASEQLQVAAVFSFAVDGSITSEQHEGAREAGRSDAPLVAALHTTCHNTGRLSRLSARVCTAAGNATFSAAAVLSP